MSDVASGRVVNLYNSLEVLIALQTKMLTAVAQHHVDKGCNNQAVGFEEGESADMDTKSRVCQRLN